MSKKQISGPILAEIWAPNLFLVEKIILCNIQEN